MDERNRTEGLDGPNYPMVLELISEILLAVDNRIEASKDEPLGRGGFLKIARKHSGVAALLADEIAYQASVSLMLAADSHDAFWDQDDV